MRVLLDECIPRRLAGSFSDYDCLTVPEAGFAGKKNGELLSMAERAGFGVLVTMDTGIEYQQNLRGRRIGIIILRARSNRLADLLPLVPDCLAQLRSVQPGTILRLGE
ncbi:MAG: DUF5615 family PIN-like protein [Bryobacteraceae bacterium]|jgi:predicted nuclease of predicted toxin-antitoxin system